MAILPVKGVLPEIHDSVWVADNATITGDVHIGKESSIWFQVVIRGDVNQIQIGEKVNIQDATIVHGSHGKAPTVIGNNVSIGHRAIIHGCTIKDNVLIGMGAILLDDAVIESNVIVGAGAVVTGGSVLESGFLYAGIPAKKIKPLDEAKSDFYVKGTAAAYVEYRKYYM